MAWATVKGFCEHVGYLLLWLIESHSSIICFACLSIGLFVCFLVCLIVYCLVSLLFVVCCLFVYWLVRVFLWLRVWVLVWCLRWTCLSACMRCSRFSFLHHRFRFSLLPFLLTLLSDSFCLSRILPPLYLSSPYAWDVRHSNSFSHHLPTTPQSRSCPTFLSYFLTLLSIG